MKPETTKFWPLVGLVVFGVVAAASLVLPRLQSPRLQLSGEVNVELERARRLLASYDANLSLDVDLRRHLGEDLFKLTSEQVTELLEDPAWDTYKELADTRLSEYAQRPEVKALPDSERKFLELQYGPEEGPRHAQSPPPPTKFAPKMVNEGLSAFEKKLAANARLLDEAGKAVSDALGLSRGEHSARQHADALRLRGRIFYQKGLAASRLISLLRGDLAARRVEIGRQHEAHAALLREQSSVTASGIDDRITEAETQQRDVAARAQQQKARVEELSARVAELQGRLASAVSRGDAARETMEALVDMGADLNNPRGFEEFRRTYEEQAGSYHAALAEAHVVEHGTLLNAALDRSGDDLRGRYVPASADGEIAVERGLKHVQDDLKAAEIERQRLEDSAAELEQHVQHLKNNKRLLSERVQQALTQAEELHSQIQASYSDYMDLYERVQQVQDETIAQFDKATSDFKLASSGLASSDAWLRGQVSAQQADTDLQVAAILLGRYQDARASSADLASLEEASEDLPSWKQAEESARQEAIAKVQGAIEQLARAKGQVGSGNWTVAAEIGAANYLLALLGEEMADQRALEWYKAAIEGREDLAPDHVAMKRYIEARLSSPAVSPPRD